MNKTEYMNTLKEALDGLPTDVVADTLSFYEQQFTEGLAAGLSEVSISEKLPKPRLVAAQKRADMQYKKLKTQMTPTTFLGVLLSFMMVMIFNFFMLIPTAMYAIFLFSAYIVSFIIYFFGIGIMATSLSGVSQMQFNFADMHAHRSSHSFHEHTSNRFHINIDQDEFKIIESNADTNPNIKTHDVAINIDSQGVKIEKTIQIAPDAQLQENAADKELSQVGENKNIFTKDELEDVFTRQIEKDRETETVPHIVNIKNKLQTKHSLFGFALLMLSIGLFILCLWMTKMTFVWFKKYLLWNLSLLRAPVRAEEQAN